MRKYLETANVPWRLLAVLCVVHIVLAVYYVIRQNAPTFSYVGVNVVGILDAVVLGCLCLKGSRALLWPRATGPELRTSRRFSPALLGMACFCVAFSSFTLLIYTEILHQPPLFPSPKHFFILLAYPFLIWAVLVLPSQRLPLMARLYLLLDSLIVMVALTTLCYYFIFAPLLAGGKGTVLAKIMIGIFPSADLVWIFCLLLIALRFGETALQPVLMMLGLTALSLFVMHIAHFYELLYIGYQPLSLANVLYLLDGVLIVGAAQTLRRTLDKGETADTQAASRAEQNGFFSQLGRWKSLLPSALVLIFSLLAFGIWFTGGIKHLHGHIVIVYAGGFVVLLLMVLRQFLVMHEVNVLQKDLWAKNRSLHLLNKQLEQQAITDSLTNLPHHQALIEYLDAALARAEAQRVPCSLLFIDIDHFKSINDTYGHPVGDAVLCQFGELLESALRTTDYVGRWGGEEFLAVLAGTNGNEAYHVAESIRLLVARHVFTHEGEDLPLTCSLGLATYPHDANQRETLIMLADAAMYAAKRLGRNQTRTAREPGVLALARATETPQTLTEKKVLNLVEALIALQEGRDRPTSQHERRVAALAQRVALHMGLSEEAAYVVSLGGLLHDLGKVALPDRLLLKRGHLTEEEFSAVRTHPVIGAQVLSALPALNEVTAIVHSHHEWMDGSGYPDKLVGETIPLGARIVAVVDAYDVITHHRPYQPAHSSTEALLALQKNAGRQFDPRIVAALIHLLVDNSLQQVGGSA